MHYLALYLLLSTSDLALCQEAASAAASQPYRVHTETECFCLGLSDATILDNFVHPRPRHQHGDAHDQHDHDNIRASLANSLELAREECSTR